MDEDIIYTSGYIDGDGCFHIGIIHQKFRPCLAISSSRPEILYHLHKTYGGYIYFSKNHPETQRPWGQWSIAGGLSRDLSQKFLPYLVQRQEECSKYISYFDCPSAVKKRKVADELKELKKAYLINRDILEEVRSLEAVISPSKEDFIYLAGFIDAECCLTIQKDVSKKRPNPTFKALCRLNDTKAPMFYWLKSRFGGSVTWVSKKKGCNPQLAWILRGKGLYDLLIKISPYLRCKKPVADCLIEFYETTLPNGGDRHSEAFKAMYSCILQKREAIVSKVRHLNRKGP